MTALLCAAMHAEHLQRDDVWAAVTRFAAAFERRRLSLTLFVHPFHAIRAGFDLTSRLAELRERGHEIGQHTHYYARFEESADGVRKQTSLDAGTIVRCLDRDHAYLREAGIEPTGYVSGGWAIRDEIFAWLADHGFRYDCSFRSYRLPYSNPDAVAGDDAEGPFRMDGVLEIPTTAAMSSWMWRRTARREVAAGGMRYRLVYLHDTDLIGRAKGLVFRRVAPLFAGSSRSVTGAELASAVAHELGGKNHG